MFDHCKTLAELNAERIKAVTAGGDLIAINNAYNARRNEIVSARKPYRVLKSVTTPKGSSDTYSYLTVLGRSDKLGVIKYTPQGFYL